MEIAEIRKLKAIEIEDHIATEESNLRRLRSSHKVSPLENPMRIRNARRLVARMKTVLQEVNVRGGEGSEAVEEVSAPVVAAKEVSNEEKQKA